MADSEQQTEHYHTPGFSELSWHQLHTRRTVSPAQGPWRLVNHRYSKRREDKPPNDQINLLFF